MGLVLGCGVGLGHSLDILFHKKMLLKPLVLATNLKRWFLKDKAGGRAGFGPLVLSLALCLLLWLLPVPGVVGGALAVTGVGAGLWVWAWPWP